MIRAGVQQEQIFHGTLYENGVAFARCLHIHNDTYTALTCGEEELADYHRVGEVDEAEWEMIRNKKANVD